MRHVSTRFQVFTPTARLMSAGCFCSGSTDVLMGSLMSDEAHGGVWSWDGDDGSSGCRLFCSVLFAVAHLFLDKNELLMHSVSGSRARGV